MESHGRRGCIRVTRATYEIINDEFACEPQVVIDVKGLGMTETWFVRGHVSSALTAPDCRHA